MLSSVHLVVVRVRVKAKCEDLCRVKDPAFKLSEVKLVKITASGSNPAT